MPDEADASLPGMAVPFGRQADGSPALRSYSHIGATGMKRDILALLCPDWRRATMIVDAKDRAIEFANWQCLELFNDEAIMRIASGRIEYRSAQLNRRFQLALERIRCSEATHEMLAANFDTMSLMITIRAVDGLLAEVVRARLGDLDGSESFAVVEIATADDLPSAGAIEVLAAMFHLTPSELKILEGFANGETLEQIARSNALALGTIRQGMKSILNKAHCRRQVDLALMVSRLCGD